MLGKGVEYFCLPAIATSDGGDISKTQGGVG